MGKKLNPYLNTLLNTLNLIDIVLKAKLKLLLENIVSLVYTHEGFPMKQKAQTTKE